MELNVRLVLLWVLVLHCGSAEGSFLYSVQEEQAPNTLIDSLAADQGLPDLGHLYKLEFGAPYICVHVKTGGHFHQRDSH
ncbi:hypothetical protein PBY51_022855 [Eleginops maclovinus]|uniref:Uncharacterized protein n=1 Tax=Eleginops maclovinus TaxID=56733 RepID=A0AAN7XKN5_ELEMC|nr:hypothetical protein PBY51_022855 [Eleginops maclovinus]